MTHEQIVNSGRIQFFVWDATAKMFRRDFDGEMFFTRDGYNRLWEARHV